MHSKGHGGCSLSTTKEHHQTNLQHFKAMGRTLGFCLIMDALQNDQMCQSIGPPDDVSIALHAFKGITMDALQNDQMCRSIGPPDDVSIALHAFKGIIMDALQNDQMCRSIVPPDDASIG
jgi:hypothetical protein